MRFKRIALATGAAGIGMWCLAGLWHNLVMPGLYADRHATHDGIATLLAAYLVLGALMSLFYESSTWRGPSKAKGLVFGGLMGITWVFPHELAMAGAHAGTSIAYVFENAGWHLVEQGLGGLVISLVLGGVQSPLYSGSPGDR